MALAGHPPHRSGRAEFPHPALALGNNVKPRLRMLDGFILAGSSYAPSHPIIPVPGSASGGTAAQAHSPWLAAFPPSPPPLAVCSGTSCEVAFAPVLCHHPTACLRSSSACVLGLPHAAQDPHLYRLGRRQALPIPVRSVSEHAWGLRPRRACFGLALTPWQCCLPEETNSSALWCRIVFRGSIPSLLVPLSTLRRRNYSLPCMTRGQYGSLLLHRLRLSL
jgi:hypothetical protein